MCMIVERNNRLTIEGERRIPFIVINCGTIQVLNWIMVEVEHWNWMLTNLNELMLRQIVIRK